MTSLMLHKSHFIPDRSDKFIFTLIGKCIEVMRSGNEIIDRTNLYKVKNINELNSLRIDIRTACLLIIAFFSALKISKVLKLDIDCVKSGRNQYGERYYIIEVEPQNAFYQKDKLQLHEHEIVIEAVETILKVFEYDRGDDKALFVCFKKRWKNDNKSKRLAVVNIKKAIEVFIERHPDLKEKIGNWKFDVGRFKLLSAMLRNTKLFEEYIAYMHLSQMAMHYNMIEDELCLSILK